MQEESRTEYTNKIIQAIYNDKESIEKREKGIEKAVETYIKQNNITKFYKYRNISEYSLNNIREKSIWLSVASDFNDICDSAVIFAKEKDWESLRESMEAVLRGSGNSKWAILLAECIVKLTDICLDQKGKNIVCDVHDIFQKYLIEEVQRKTLVSCFCETYKSTYMWGIYGDNGKGICLEYDYNDIKDLIVNNNMAFVPVVYQEDFPNARKLFFEYIRTKETFETNYLAAIKSSEWKQEREWRIIGRSEEKIGKNIQEISPTQIYFGPNINAKDKEKVMRSLDDNIPKKKMVKMTGKFLLEAVDD